MKPHFLLQETSVNHLTADDAFMISVGAFRFEDRFCANKKKWDRGGGQVSVWGTIHMAAALAGCRMALVGTG